MEVDIQAVSARDTFRRAKIDHFLQRAEEYIHMGRYTTAQRTMERVLDLDPENQACRDLRKTVDDLLYRIHHRRNGAASGEQRSEGEVPRKYRTELVLIVDQDEQLLISLSESLHRYGFETISAASYEEAVETINAVKPDVILSEVNFETGPRGFDLYFWVKTNGNFAAVPFLFLAARIDRDVLIAGKRFGVDDFILKPADNDVVTASIVNSLARRRKPAG